MTDAAVADVMPVVLPDSPRELAGLIDAAITKLGSVSLGLASDTEVTATVETLERAWRRADGVNAALLVQVSDRNLWLGYATPRAWYSEYLRLGPGEARRREVVAEAIGVCTALTGQPLPPKREPLAVAVAAGTVSGEHVRVIEQVLDKIPHQADPREVAAAVTVLTEAAKAATPKDMNRLGQRILAHLDPDGTLTDDTDRHRRRSLHLGAQGADLMSKLCGYVTPQVRAKLEVLLDNWGKPGMNNPDDDDEHRITGPLALMTLDDTGPNHTTGPDGTATGHDTTVADARHQALIQARGRDTWTSAQRDHDALEAGLDWLLGHQALGKPDRIPAEVVITIDEHDLARRAGIGVTATGTMVPVGDLIHLAADATPWLAVFHHHTRSVLDFGRGRRLATKTQRLALFAAEPGCSKPGCGQPFSRTQAHHATRDYARGGSTDVTDMTGACGRHNRAVGTKPGQWETHVFSDGPHTGRTGWRRTGTDQPFRVNHTHDPRTYLHGTVFDPNQHDHDQAAGDDSGPPPGLADPPPDEPVMRRVNPQFGRRGGLSRRISTDAPRRRLRGHGLRWSALQVLPWPYAR
ncbi:DUF222 domain-containing protein [Gordonia sp. X0973]|uniref:HNH endonuclease signature motif containing protein n=1 Tax=Gordonia sp. X0973 TaxID=2742602 RepID=UPI0015824E75|nr:HNH endonuclease signature motif containing protein [Gordonia sp. X0973]QKT06406.1 DUF222 domain-containing protein [Gordonia sp. X0973]